MARVEEALSQSIDDSLSCYITRLRFWEIYSLPCFCFLPVVGCIFDGANEDAMMSNYQSARSRISDLDRRSLLDPTETTIWSEINRETIHDMHWGRVKEVGQDHIWQMKGMLRNMRGEYTLVLEELQQSINWYKCAVGCHRIYALSCFILLPIAGCCMLGCRENQFLRVYGSIWYTFELLSLRGLMNASEGADWASIKNLAGGRMRDPSWGRAFEVGLVHVDRMDLLLLRMKSNWQQTLHRMDVSRSTHTRKTAHAHTYAHAQSVVPQCLVPPVAVEMERHQERLTSKADAPYADVGVRAAYATGDTATAYPTASESNATATGQGQPTLAQKLQELRESKDAGLLSEEEFQAAKAGLISSWVGQR
jgi:hypothetical protein